MRGTKLEPEAGKPLPKDEPAGLVRAFGLWSTSVGPMSAKLKKVSASCLSAASCGFNTGRWLGEQQPEQIWGEESWWRLCRWPWTTCEKTRRSIHGATAGRLVLILLGLSIGDDVPNPYHKPCAQDP